MAVPVGGLAFDYFGYVGTMSGTSTTEPRRRYLSLNRTAWRQIREAWDVPLSAPVLWQNVVAAPLFSAIGRLQRLLTKGDAPERPRGAVFVIGYWRSGTTLLHELLCCDQRFGYPTTWACFNPHHFRIASAPSATVSTRPMDGMVLHQGSPQEDEFALLARGARSPYEALIAPGHLAAALTLGDPRDLPPDQEAAWREVFCGLLTDIAAAAGHRPLVLKSPTHSYRVATIRQLFPDARFVLMVRNPFEVFESAVRMWTSLFRLYALSPIPDEDNIRHAVLADRLTLEAKMNAGLQGLSPRQLIVVRFEDLRSEPLAVLEEIYGRLDLPDFAQARPAVLAELAARGGYTPAATQPSEFWKSRLAQEWRSLFDTYGYDGTEC